MSAIVQILTGELPAHVKEAKRKKACKRWRARRKAEQATGGGK